MYAKASLWFPLAAAIFLGDADQVVPFGPTTADGPGGAGTTKTFKIADAGTAPVTLNSVLLKSGTRFTLVGPDLTGTVLGIGESVDIGVRFDPTTVGNVSDTLAVTSDSPANPPSR